MDLIDLHKIVFKYRRCHEISTERNGSGLFYDKDGVPRAFLKISTNSEILEREYFNTRRLQQYDFVPKIISFNKHIKFDGEIWAVLILEVIDGKSLNSETLESNPSIFCKILDILQLLYEEQNFLHGDLDISNLMISNKGKLFMIDFEFSSFSAKNKWLTDINGMICSVYSDKDPINKIYNYIISTKSDYKRDTNPDTQKAFFQTIKNMI